MAPPVALWIGLDDTDSPRTMCTTYVAAELVARAPGLDLVGHPRLVRLNPNVPWKTRGNGALCLRLGRGRGRPFPVGRVRGRALLAYPRGTTPEVEGNLVETCRQVLLELADLEDANSQPALVVTRRRPGAALYWRAVREVLDPEVVEPLVDRADLVLAPKGPRGLIGAFAALAWRPRDRTYEVLAYREPSRWGTPRRVEPSDVRALDRRFPTTFHNHDPETGHLAVVPRSPCPVLLGIRGEDPRELPAALESVRSEPVERWLLFETNQATGDHLVRRDLEALRPHLSAVVEGRVLAVPRTLPGGHVVFPLGDGGTAVDCVAYEPSKSFRRTIRALLPGDRVRASGGVRAEPRSLNLEKLEVLALRPAVAKVANPPCPACGRSMKSLGRGAGYRCRRCGTRAGPHAATHAPVVRSLAPGAYEPPVSARRHLHRPRRRTADRGT